MKIIITQITQVAGHDGNLPYSNQIIHGKKVNYLLTLLPLALEYYLTDSDVNEYFPCEIL